MTALLKTNSKFCEHEAKPEDCELYLEEFRLELVTDIDMFLMFGKGLHGGITQAVKHYGKANNKFIKRYYNFDETSTYLNISMQTTFMDGQ